MKELGELIGSKIERVAISSDKTTIQFYSNCDCFIYYVEADCCSETWINHFEGIQNLLNALVIDVEENIQQDSLPSEKQDYDIQYGVTIKTNKGYAKLEYRNASNGFYGGWLEFGGKISADPTPDDYDEITEDF